jgi:hypothetical protein
MGTTNAKRQTYVAPDTSVDIIVQERSFLSEIEPGFMSDMDPNELFDEDF